ncbi:MAG TPA: hypothetical protein VIT90_17045 [Lysobacter sp.]
MNTVTGNPDPLRTADLSDGIPLALWNGSNQTARDLLLAEHQRQRAHAARQREAADTERQESLRRILATHADDHAGRQLRRLQELLFEAAITARTLAMTLPAPDGVTPDADASQTQESPP